jgi:tagatose-1,6-bisphosphate aldolase non-catalytic subunit AgaZ/GatZ
VARKTETAHQRNDVDALEAEVSTLLREIDVERSQIRPRILAGDNTAPVRARIKALEDNLAGARARIEVLVAARFARLAADAERDAADIAGTLVTALAAKLAALEPPVRPSK